MNDLNSDKAQEVSSNLLCRTNETALKPAPIAGFILDKISSVKTVSRIAHYIAPTIVRSIHGWYIKYRYRVPVELREVYPGKTWMTFRLKLDINYRKGKDKELYADWLLKEITDSLKEGYNPFEQAIKRMEAEGHGLEVIKKPNCKIAIELFLQKWSRKGLESSSLQKYKKVMARFAQWLIKTGLLDADVETIKTRHVETFLADGRSAYNFSNREYNNTIGFLSTFFNFCVKEEYIDRNPVNGVAKLKTTATKHRYYDDDSLTTIFKAMEAVDPYCMVAFKTVYYLCIRADKELQGLKIGNIDYENNRVFLESSGTKGNSARYIPLDENMKEVFQKYGVQNYPASFYVFGIKGCPAEKPFAHTFFSKRFRKVREAAGLPQHFTLYGAKHTRIIHLKNAGALDSDIMHLTGHKDIGSYSKYLRDLGLTADVQKINKLSRKL